MRRWLLGAALILTLVGSLAFAASQLQLANHFGYALPGPHGLPFRVSFAGRDYENDNTCAGAGWCGSNSLPGCTSSAQLRAYGYWPLQRVGSLFTLFGAPWPMLRAPTPHGMTTMALYIPHGRGCLVVYDLEGGP